MIKILSLLLIFLVISKPVSGQFIVNGKVIAKNDKSYIPGVQIAEKGSINNAITSLDGSFTISVTNKNAILIFSFVGMKPHEFSLNGKSEIVVQLKDDCYLDYFDAQKIIIYAKSGLLKTPVGGEVEIALPHVYLLGIATIKASIGYQTNFDNNNFFNGQLEVGHFISTCEYSMDARINYRQVSIMRDFKLKAFSLETDLNLNKIKLVAGYSNLSNNQVSSGCLVGLGTFIGKPFYSTIVGKVSFYKSNIEYHGLIKTQSKNFYSFVRFYKLSLFNELSLGIGTSIGYKIKRKI